MSDKSKELDKVENADFKISYLSAIFYTFLLVMFTFFSIFLVETLSLSSKLVLWKGQIVQLISFLFLIGFVAQIHLAKREIVNLNFFGKVGFIQIFYSIVLFISCIFLSEWYVNTIPKDGLLKEHFDLFISTMQKQLASPMQGIVSAVLIAPLFEEIYFRGFILQGLLNNKYSPKIAIIFSAILFSILHGFIWSIAGAFFLGIAIGYVYFISRSLSLVILLHLINNSIAAYYLYTNQGNFLEFVKNSEIGLPHYLSIFLAPIFGYLLYHSTKKNT